MTSLSERENRGAFWHTSSRQGMGRLYQVLTMFWNPFRVMPLYVPENINIPTLLHLGKHNVRSLHLKCQSFCCWVVHAIIKCRKWTNDSIDVITETEVKVFHIVEYCVHVSVTTGGGAGWAPPPPSLTCDDVHPDVLEAAIVGGILGSLPSQNPPPKHTGCI